MSQAARRASGRADYVDDSRQEEEEDEDEDGNEDDDQSEEDYNYNDPNERSRQ